MSETSASTPSSQTQTSSLFVDRPCLKCGYNLRGQTATWNRRALNWQATCPECGNDQVVTLGAAERGGVQNPMVAVILALVALWIAWQLFLSLSASIASIMEVPMTIDAPMNTVAARRAAMGASVTGAGAATAFDGEWTTLVLHVIVRAVPILLVTILLGILLSIAPHGRHRQRDLLMVMFVVAGCLFGAYVNITGAGDPISSQIRAQLLSVAGASGIGTGGVLFVYDWKWRVASGIIGLMLAVVGGRIGLASGQPLGKIVAGLYVRTDG